MTATHAATRRRGRSGLVLAIGAVALLMAQALSAEQEEEETTQPCPPGYRVCGSGCCPA